jgi:VIT1/CCC1 family predicted Fe2+/Mn2+ transporter
VTDGRRTRVVAIATPILVGRDASCDISDPDLLLSRRHAAFIPDATSVTVRDLGSRHGILVNGARVSECVLRSGDVVQIGPLRIRFTDDDAPGEVTEPPASTDSTAMYPVPYAQDPRALAGDRPTSEVRRPTDAFTRSSLRPLSVAALTTFIYVKVGLLAGIAVLALLAPFVAFGPSVRWRWTAVSIAIVLALTAVVGTSISRRVVKTIMSERTKSQ